MRKPFTPLALSAPLCLLLLAGASAALAQRPRERPLTAKEAFRAVEGAWSMIHHESSGELINTVDPTKRTTFRGDRWSVEHDGEIVLAGTMRYERDWEGPGLAFDLIVNTGGRRGQVMKVILAVQDGKLYQAARVEGGARPRAFRSEPGDEVTYSVWRRAR